jgi:hypothetical protein
VTRLASVLTISASALVLAACGSEKKTVTEAGRPVVACGGSALADTGLPPGFPKPDGVTYTKTANAGPSKIVDGYFEGSLDEVHDAYKSALSTGGYDVLFDELEEHDSEVSYEGEQRTGQVALRDQCKEDGRIAVHVTSRPE